MLTLNIIDNSVLFEDRIEKYFLFLTYCKKYNFNFLYNKTNNVDNYCLSNIDITNIHTTFINLNNNDTRITLIINKYYSNIIYFYLSFEDIIKEIYNFNYDNNLFIRNIIFNYKYVCIHIFTDNIITNTINYLSINYFKEKYDLLEDYYKSLKLVIITNNDINKQFENYILINDDNDIDNFNIMINSAYLIISNKKIDYYAKLLNKNYTNKLKVILNMTV
jgi:hypothetical protein